MKSEYEADGFVFRPGLLDAAETAVLVAELERVLVEEPRDERFILERDGVTVRTVANLHQRSMVYDHLVHHPLLLDAARELLDDDVYVFQLGVNCKAAFNGDAWFWHQDFPGYREDDHIPEPRMVNTLIFLDEVMNTNGPLMLVPGSHRHVAATPAVSDGGTSYSFRYADTETIKEQVRVGGVVAPTGPPGSVIFMNVNTLHGSTGNMSPWPRRMITVTFNAMSNKATSPSVRPRHIVGDDRDATALMPMDASCLLELAR
jgi:ectoine hydroxylase